MHLARWNLLMNVYKKVIMVSVHFLRKLVLSFPEVTEEPHFDKTSFRVKKKIFATYDEANNRACLKLSEIDQDVFSLVDQTVIYPVNNSWGKQGWTYIEMNKVREELFVDVLTRAYRKVATKKLGNMIQSEEDELKN